MRTMTELSYCAEYAIGIVYVDGNHVSRQRFLPTFASSSATSVTSERKGSAATLCELGAPANALGLCDHRLGLVCLSRNAALGLLVESAPRATRLGSLQERVNSRRRVTSMGHGRQRCYGAEDWHGHWHRGVQRSGGRRTTNNGGG